MASHQLFVHLVPGPAELSQTALVEHANDLAVVARSLDLSKAHVTVPSVPQANADRSLPRQLSDRLRHAWLQTCAFALAETIRSEGGRGEVVVSSLHDLPKMPISLVPVFTPKVGVLSIFAQWDGETLLDTGLIIAILATQNAGELIYHVPIEKAQTIPDLNSLSGNERIVALMRADLPSTAVAACQHAGVTVTFSN